MASTCRESAAVGHSSERRGESVTGSRRAESQSHRRGWVDSEAKAATNQGSARIDWKLTWIRIGREKVRESESDKIRFLVCGEEELTWPRVISCSLD